MPTYARAYRQLYLSLCAVILFVRFFFVSVYRAQAMSFFFLVSCNLFNMNRFGAFFGFCFAVVEF